MFICTARAIKYGGQHGHAVLGEGIRKKAGIAVFLGTGRNLRPVERCGLFDRKPEHEIGREAAQVTFYLFVEALRGYLVEPGQVRVEHHFLTADEVDAPLDHL
jgi:hypothetical protein